MIFIKKEHHRVISNFVYHIPDDDIVKNFGSIERFKEIASHLGSQETWDDPIGDSPSDTETDNFYEFIDSYDCEDRNDDWVTDRKGGYDVTYELDYGVDL